MFGDNKLVIELLCILLLTLCWLRGGGFRSPHGFSGNFFFGAELVYFLFVVPSKTLFRIFWYTIDYPGPTLPTKNPSWTLVAQGPSR